MELAGRRDLLEQGSDSWNPRLHPGHVLFDSLSKIKPLELPGLIELRIALLQTCHGRVTKTAPSGLEFFPEPFFMTQIFASQATGYLLFLSACTNIFYFS